MTTVCSTARGLRYDDEFVATRSSTPWATCTGGQPLAAYSAFRRATR